MKQKYNVDIITTDGCNLRCKYCVESGFQGHTQKFKKVETTILHKLGDKIDALLLNPWFNDGFDSVRVNFWGGEPTLNLEAMQYMLDRYADNDRVCFYVFTNAYNMEQFLKLYVKYKDVTVGDSYGEPKFGMQISYDGLPVQNIKRVTVNEKTTGDKVRENIIKCIDLKVPVVLHPVITVDTFKNMFDCYLDYLDLYKYALSVYEKGQNFPRINYSPNLDYFNDNSNNFKLEYFDDLYDNMLKIAEHMKNEQISRPNLFKMSGEFFPWTSNFKQTSLCSVGTSITAMDGDGDFYFCHGAFFQSDPDTKQHFHIASVYDEDEKWISKIQQVSNDCSKHRTEVPEKCTTCTTKMCLRCQVVSFARSEKKAFWDRWTDYNASNFNCKLFNLITLYDKKIKHLMDK